jgi:hypothetical protein
MTPSDLKRLNVDRFERMLRSETDPEKLALIGRLLAEERVKDDSAYPADRPATNDGRVLKAAPVAK